MAELPWYQRKKWVVSAGLVCGVGLGLFMLEPIVDDFVPILQSESASESEPEDPQPAEPGATSADEADASDATEPEEAGTDPDSTDEDANGDGPEPGPESGDAYELVILGTEDVSEDGTALTAISAELNIYPVDKAKLRNALDGELEQFRGEANAVSIKVFYDRREGGPAAFGVWTWAPEGDWTKAEDGDPETWDGYQWGEPEIQKLDSPESCTPPTEAELDLAGAYYGRQISEPPGPEPEPEPEAGDAEPDAEPEGGEPEAGEGEADLMDEVAEEAGTTVEQLTEALDATSRWTSC